MRVEVERVARELGLELGLGAIAIAGFEQGAAVERVHAGQLGVERHGLAQRFEAAGEIAAAPLGHPQHQLGFRRLAALEDPVDEHAALFHLLLLEIGQAEHVGEREIVLVRRLERREQLDDLLRRAHPQVAVGLEVARLQVVGLARCAPRPAR